MAQLDDLVAQCQPYYGVVIGEASEGRSWDWTLAGFIDGTGALIDFTVGGITWDGKVLATDGTTTVVTMTVTGGIGSIHFTDTPAATVGTAGTGLTCAKYPWYLTITTPTARKVDIWGPEQSRLIVRAAA